MPEEERTIVGAAERVELPEWGLRLRAKVDTGAKTSALHVEDIEELEGERVRFVVVTSRRTRARRVQVVADIVRRAHIRSSSGQGGDRLVVATVLVLGGVRKRIEISLTSRRGMLFRMLLGRLALADDFLVDPSRRYVHGRPRRRRRGSPVKTVARTRRLSRLRPKVVSAPDATPKKAKATRRARKGEEVG